jgi:hypothetical protein
MRLYHVSRQNLDGQILTPRVPECSFDSPGEDRRRKRVCFAYTIEGCLIAIQHQATSKAVLHIHVPVDYKGKIVHTDIVRNKVPDGLHTGEVWLTSKVKLKRVGTVKLHDYDYNNRVVLPGCEWGVMFYPYDIVDVVDDSFMKDLTLSSNIEQWTELGFDYKEMLK